MSTFQHEITETRFRFLSFQRAQTCVQIILFHNALSPSVNPYLLNNQSLMLSPSSLKSSGEILSILGALFLIKRYNGLVQFLPDWWFLFLTEPSVDFYFFRWGKLGKLCNSSCLSTLSRFSKYSALIWRWAASCFMIWNL